MPSKELIRRKNYIGEAIIAEREDEEDPDDKPQQAAPASSLHSKISKIAKLADESLKDYREQKKTTEVLAKEQALLSRARL